MLLVNERLHSPLNSAKASVHRIGGALADEIIAEQTAVIAEAMPVANATYLTQLAALLASLRDVQDEINAANKAVKKGTVPFPAFATTIEKMDDFTCQALSLDERPSNFGGLATGRSMNWKYMTCSYLQHPDSILKADCPINVEIENTILNLPGDKC